MTVETRIPQSSTWSALEARFPALARVPRAALGRYPSAVDVVDVGGGVRVWIKRDDRNADVCGGNKVRALEYLLAGVEPGDTVVTLGGRGSTHVLATATHAARLGARTVAVTWTHEMNPTAVTVERLCGERCARIIPTANALAAVARVAVIRTEHVFGGHRGPSWHFVPVGGTSALGMLGHVSAGLELARQIDDGVLPCPATVVVPLGTGGTAAGLALGLGAGGARTTVTAARVVPWAAAPPWRIPWLLARARRFIRARTGERVAAVPVRVEHGVYGGAYGRALPDGPAAAAQLGLGLDATYGAKAGAAALAYALARRGSVLLWMTFDARQVSPVEHARLD